MYITSSFVVILIVHLLFIIYFKSVVFPVYLFSVLSELHIQCEIMYLQLYMLSKDSDQSEHLSLISLSWVLIG